MNPLMLMKIKEKIENFTGEHPKMVPFFQTINREAISEGSVLELKAISTEGKEYVANIKLTSNDIELIKMLSEFR